MENKTNLDIKDYQRLFSHNGLRFLINDIAMNGYSGLGLISLVKEDNLTNYIPKSIIEKTSVEGLELYGSKKKFSLFVSNFREIYKKLVAFCDEILLDSPLSKTQIKELFDEYIEFISEYKKTEFIYVDKPYLESKKGNNPELIDNLKEYEKVKFEFRGLINVIFFGNSSYYQRILEKLAKQTNIDQEDLQQYKSEEILGLFEGKKVDKNTIDERFYHNIIIDDNNQFRHYWGNEAEEIINHFFKNKEDNELIRGTIVNRGKVRGIARVIKPSWHEGFTKVKEAMERMNKGDILISETTSPDIMVAIRKAGAIVTDQGGLMSHAAIMSREMNVPGIVGADKATRLIKEGDLIEVDAYTGIVRILNRN